MESIDTISKWLYIGVTVWVCSLWTGITIFGVIIGICLQDDKEDLECFSATSVGIILNGVCFAILSLLLLMAVIPLFSSLRKLSSQGQMKLTQEVKMLSTVFAIFSFGFVTRTLYDFIVPPNLNFNNIFSGVCLPILWEFVPIFLMFAYHYQNLKQLKKKTT